jgi:hypothetical protein
MSLRSERWFAATFVVVQLVAAGGIERGRLAQTPGAERDPTLVEWRVIAFTLP